MIFIPEKEAPLSEPDLLRSLVAGVPRAYAVLFFSASVPLGWWLLAVSMISPVVGLCGLAGVIGAALLAWFLGYDRTMVRTGFGLFNPLLVCMTVGWLHHCHDFPLPTLVLLLAAGSAGGFFLARTVNARVFASFGISAHSLPAVMAGYVLYLMSHSLFGPAVPPPQQEIGWLDLPFLAGPWKGLFQAFGNMVFQVRVVPGILTFAGLAIVSPLTTLVAAASYAAGVLVLGQLGGAPEAVGGYNFILCGIALGAGYYVTSASSLLLAFAGSAFCAVTGMATASALQYFLLPPSALPYNLVVLTLLPALAQRTRRGKLIPSPAPGIMPESSARQVLLQHHRFPDLLKPSLLLPFDGPRVITQGFAGALTHRGKWQHALDFEIENEGRKYRGPGETLTDFYLYGTPVLAPCSGVVVYVENAVPDNDPGRNNPDRNWGNCVIIGSDAGTFVLLAHLKTGSVPVSAGQRVAAGEIIGECGNSGRSPVPHLHLQMQATGWFGVPTLPFCLRHYLECLPDGGLVYHTSGVPESGVTIRSPKNEPALAELFCGFLPGEYRYRITENAGAAREETVRLDFDEFGRYRFRSRRWGAELIAFIRDGVFYCMDYTGSGHSVLALIAAGMARVPCLADPEVTWTDGVSSVPFHTGAARWAMDLLEPFCGPFILRFCYRMEPEHGGGYAIHATAAGDGDGMAPKNITCGIQPLRGILRIEVRRHNDQVVRVVQTDYHPARIAG